jgi:N-hydroxyarylamine O-acetyltransferase
MQIESCLERIRYDGPRNPTLNVLSSLQEAFLLSVPFENLDILEGRDIVLSSRAVYDKIVLKHRGGVCFERTLLFFELLKALGFRAELLSCRMVRNGVIGPDYEHMALLVRLGHDHLVDIGDSHGCRTPLRIDGSDAPLADDALFRIQACEQGYALMSRHGSAEWSVRFVFDLIPHNAAEFEAMNRFHQTSPESSFTGRRLVTLPTPDGRISLIDRQCVITAGESRRMSRISSDEEYRECLKRLFGIELINGRG